MTLRYVASFRLFALLLLLPLFGTFGSSATTTFNASHSPPIGFDFQESRCINDTFPNLGSLSGEGSWLFLRRNASTTSFSTGNLGLESHPSDPELLSNHLYGSMQPLLTSLQEARGGDDENSTAAASGDGISISLWIRSLQNDDLRSPILTVGRAESAATTVYGITECDRRQIDLQLTLQNRSLTLVYRTNDPFFEPCQLLRLTNNISLSRDELTHVAIVLTHRRQQIFINGQPSGIMREPFDASLTHWSRAGVLHLFSYQDQPSWFGRLYRLQLYKSAWDREHVYRIMSQGLPPALPHASAVTHRMFEDAEILPGSHSAEWYEHPNTFQESSTRPNELPELHLPITFLDEEVETLLKSRGISHSKAPRVFIYISKLPEQGTLYRLNGSILSATGYHPDLVLLPQSSVVYIPEHNDYSALPGSIYTSIEYCVALQEIIASSQCLSTASISIVIDPVNDPPVALVASEEPYLVHEGIVEERLPLQLKGSDVDLGDFIAAFEIITPPRLGYLYLSVPVRREDGLFHGTLLSDLDFVIPGAETLVEYRYDDSNTLIRDLVVVDSFDFRVQDSNGSWSVPISVKIQVVSGITGTPPPHESIVVQENAIAFIPLEGLDQSGLNRSIGFFLESVPEKEDALILGQDDELLLGGTLLDSLRMNAPYDEVTGIQFQSATNLCEAKQMANASIGYRVVAYEADGRISSVSSVVDQRITVECKIKPIGLALPQDNFTTHVFTSFLNDPCSGYVYNASQMVDGVTCKSAVILEGIKVTSDLTHTERAMVSIRSNHGRLTLNQEHRSQLRLLEGQAVMRPTVKFLALPRDVDDILSHLHFQSQVVGPDEIEISIKYGECPETENVALDSFRCFSIQQSIHIDVLPALPVEKEMLFDTFPWIPLPFTLTMILLMKFKGKLRAILAIQKSKPNEDDTTMADTTNIRWKQFYDDGSGFYYYMNFEDGTVTWDPPLDEDFIPCEEAETQLPSEDQERRRIDMSTELRWDSACSL